MVSWRDDDLVNHALSFIMFFVVFAAHVPILFVVVVVVYLHPPSHASAKKKTSYNLDRQQKGHPHSKV